MQHSTLLLLSWQTCSFDSSQSAAVLLVGRSHSVWWLPILQVAAPLRLLMDVSNSPHCRGGVDGSVWLLRCCERIGDSHASCSQQATSLHISLTDELLPPNTTTSIPSPGAQLPSTTATCTLFTRPGAPLAMPMGAFPRDCLAIVDRSRRLRCDCFPICDVWGRFRRDFCDEQCAEALWFLAHWPWLEALAS